MVSQLEQYLKEISEEYDLFDKFPNVLISLTEAVNNAIRHGNKYDEGKMVEIQFKELNNGALFIVIDEGPGFNDTEIEDPTKQENLEKTGGRGVFIMEKLCDELTFHDNGRMVKLFFKF